MALFCPLFPSLPHWPLGIAVKNIMEVMTSDGDGAEEEKGAQ